MSDVQKSIDRVLGDLDRVWPGGYAAILFGSAARSQHIPGWSDINMLLVAESLALAELRAARAALERWQTDARTLPLLFTQAEWKRSADAYPLEIAEMRTAHRVLRGNDPLKGLHVRHSDLRTALEREFRGKLMRLRQGYALYATDGTKLSEFVRRSASSLLVLCRGLLVLAGQEVPVEPVAVVGAAGRLAGVGSEAMGLVVHERANPKWQCPEGLAADYLLAMQHAASFVDHFKIGAQT